jgi:hypothetical protein
MQSQDFALGQTGDQPAIGHRQRRGGNCHHLPIEDDLRATVGSYTVNGSQARAIGGNQHAALDGAHWSLGGAGGGVKEPRQRNESTQRDNDRRPLQDSLPGPMARNNLHTKQR